MKTVLEEEQKTALEKLKASELSKKQTLLKLSPETYKNMQERLVAFKEICQPLLSTQMFERAVELLDAKTTLEDFRLTLRDIEDDVKGLEENNSRVYEDLKSLLSSMDNYSKSFSDLLVQLKSELDAQNEHRTREKKTLDKIDSYISQYG